MLGALSIGAQFLGQAGSAYGDYQGQKAQADYNYRTGRRQTKLTNLQRTNQYYRDIESQKRQWGQQLMIRGAQNARYRNQVSANMTAAGRAYSQEYERIAEGFEAARFQGESNLKKLIQSEGAAAATGRSGRGLARMDAVKNLGEYGSRQAMIADNLTRSVSSSKGTFNDIWNQTNQANWNAWYPVSTPLMRPDPIAAPTLQSMPTRQSVSPMGFYGSLLGAAGSALSSWNDLQPPVDPDSNGWLG